MINQKNLQVNLPNQVSSFIGENTSKKPSFNVSYRTQEQLDHIESFRHPLLEHHRTRKKSSVFALLKLICGRHLHGEWKMCKTNQINLGKSLPLFQHNKSVGERQVRRLLTTLSEKGLINYYSVNGKFKEVKVAVPTQLGMDVYRYIILSNRSNVRLAKMNREPQKPINSIVLDEVPELKKENVRHDMGFCLKTLPDMDMENTRMNEIKTQRKIDLNAPPLSYEELQGAHLHANVCPYPEKIEPKAANEPDVHWTEKLQEGMRLSTIRKNDTMLPHAVFQMLDKNFRDEQADILCKLLLMTNECQATKISIIECVKAAMTRQYLKGEKVLNFEAFANSIMRRYLKRLYPTDLPTENVDN
jgi:hypothetical protein